ncbi:BamA/TamA family outer membrane protein [Bdellovibrio bacteriovorus]|uniref:BamA/TamA family outer membrane protein n=1 Tax=Bdellovibrio bacteriovorus TaxID=959 RepID=UPI003AA7FEAF
MPFFLLLLTLLTSVSAKAATTSLCGIRIEGSEEIKFTDTEKDWLCGTPKNDAWKSIPDNQRIFFLKSFLQSRAYHQAQFTYEKDLLLVQTGPKSHVKKLNVLHAPPVWDWKKRRYILNRPFTPNTLDEINKWALRRLQENGYVCPQVESRGIIDEETFLLDVNAGSPAVFATYPTVGEEDLDPAILERFSAFLPGEPFDIRLLELSSTRVLNEDLFLSTYYDIACQKDGSYSIVRRMIPAKPRLLSFGVGFDSEGGALIKSTFKQARLTDSADSLETSLYASFIEQYITFNHYHYFLDDLSSRTHLISGAKIRHESESNYEAMTYEMGTGVSFGKEWSTATSSFQLGPYLTRTDVIRGPGPYRIDSLYLGTEVSLTSHMYEYYLADPQKGWTVTFNSASQVEGAVANEDLHRLTLRHQVLWNLQGWDPPFLILGWRGSMGAFILPDGFTESSQIPVNWRFFMGGDADLRGFARKQLPQEGQGYLTYIYQGLELRAGDVLPYNLQPLIFFDAAKGGESSMKLNSALYYSPGAGLRWGSPIGSMRATLGRGFVIDPVPNDVDPGYQFFFSFGREF